MSSAVHPISVMMMCNCLSLCHRNVISAPQAASKKGWCLLDLEAMVAGHANEKLWMPDGLHPSDFVLKEYANMALNTLYQAKGWEASLLSSTPN